MRSDRGRFGHLVAARQTVTVQGPVDGCRCHHQPSSGLILEYRQRRPEVYVVIVGRQFNHHDGATQVPGLSFLSLPWQTKRGSTRLGIVGTDAACLADWVVAHRDVTSRLGSVDRSGAVGAAGKLPASVRVVRGPTQVR